MTKKLKQKRDDLWLLSRLDYLWSKYFADIGRINKVFIKFGRYSKVRLGSIRMDKISKNSYIIITSMFQNEKVPVEVIDHTVAHEFCHYIHGFSSPNPRLHKYPHHGGVIRKELESRRMYYLVKAFGVWKKEYRKLLTTSHK